MSGLSLTTLCGDAAHLVAAQAELICKSNGRLIYKLRTENLRIAVYHEEARRLVVFDAAALVALTDAELFADLTPSRKPTQAEHAGAVAAGHARFTSDFDPRITQE